MGDRFLHIITCVCTILVFAGCTREDRREFEVRGVVKELRPAEQEVVIKHEEIPGYMAAMTMPFEVKDTNELAGLAPNDQVTFKMIVTDREGWIENIRKTGTVVETNSVSADPTSVPGGARSGVRIARDVEPLQIGDKVPEYVFTNSFGKTVRLSDLEGKAYAFTFIFTRCPFPNFCPRMNTHFADAYKALVARSGGPTNWHLVSISFDPEFDTPERLKSYSAQYKADPERWDWVTGAPVEIEAIADQVELVFAFESGTINHNLRTAVVDKNGRLRKIFKGNEWTPEELAEELIAGAEGQPIPEESGAQEE